jgi:hypothetical protein
MRLDLCRPEALEATADSKRVSEREIDFLIGYWVINEIA